jgi:hypothetical protein
MEKKAVASAYTKYLGKPEVTGELQINYLGVPQTPITEYPDVR